MIMKNKFLRKVLSISGLVLLASFAMVSCDDDEGGKDNPILVEDGMYIVGDASPFAELSANGMMVITENEVDQASRPGMFELYVALEAGKTFNIIEVAGKDQITYGPGEGFAVVNPEGKNDQMNFEVQHGAYSQSGTFSVTESGLYQVVIDKDLGKVAILPVKYWAILGGATPVGWTDTQLPLVGAFSKTELTFQVTELELRLGNYKFRHSGGWKFQMDDVTLANLESLVKVNTNFGGTLAALEPGGADMSFAKEDEGIYTVEIKWSATEGISASMTKTGTVEPLPEYPEALYMIGNALNNADSDQDDTPDGWQWDLTDAPMIAVNSQPHLFWKIVWLETGGEFKFAPEKVWGKDFGKSGDATEGVYDKGSENIPSPATSGYYMVVVDLKENKIAVVDPTVYIIGETLDMGDNNWMTANPDALFTVDNTNQILTITKTLAAKELRMYAWHPWFSEWWQSEFMVLNGKIEFRGTGGNQERVTPTAGSNKIDLNFKTGDGSITVQ